MCVRACVRACVLISKRNGGEGMRVACLAVVAVV